MPVELDPATYGLTIWDLDREFLTGGLGGRERMALGDILHVLRDAYCRTIGIEYMHIQDQEEQRWIQDQVEGVAPELDLDDQRYILERLNAAEAFEKFLATKYVGQKRFGLEGAEAAIPILDAILEAAADADLDGSVIGMPHRGRLNVLTNIVGKSYDQLFKEFEGQVDPDSMQGSGDVKYHLGQTGKFVARSGKDITVELAANPSHLEAVDPVVVGMARAKQDAINDPEAFSILPILMHGDAAFAGQGVVAETLNMSDIKGYRVGGTIHVVVNNQIGFTTTPESARSGFYSTDVAKIIQAPILHVNGDDPEACVRVARLAFAFRQRFHKDVVIDMVCYRRHGHNEGDDPSYTQPLMYAKIEQRRSVRKLFTESLVKRGQLSLEEAEGALDDFQQRLQTALDETRQSAPTSEVLAKAPPPPARRAAPRRDRRAAGGARPDLRRAVHLPGHLPGAPEAAQAVRGARQALGRRRGRLGARRGDGLRLAAPRGHRHPHGRPGHPSRHLQPPPRGARRPHQRRRVRTARPPGRRAGQVLDLRLAAVGVRRPRVRVRLLGRRQGLARGLGGAVRRLLERRLHDRRPVHRVGRGQVDPDLGPGAVPAPRLRGTGSRAQLRRASSGSSPCARRTTSRSRTARRRRRSSTSSAGRCAAASASRWSSSRRSRCCGPGPCARRSRSCCTGRSARRSTTRGSPTRRPCAASCSPPARSARTRSPSATSSARRWRWSGSSSSTRGPTTSSTRSWPATRTPPRSCGSRRSRRTWVGGAS